MTERHSSDDVDPASLGESLQFEFSGRTTPNRFLKGAMTERLASWDRNDLQRRGVPSKELINVYKRWGEGGFGIILTGNILIDFENMEAAGNAVVPPDAVFEGERFEAFRELASQAKKHGSLVIAQLNHPGRKISVRMNPHPVSASNIPLKINFRGMSFGQPKAASQDDVDDFIERFAHAAEFLDKAGFDGVELHAAHGYLLAQFLSQTTNRRSDKYGGSIINRARIIIETAEAIRQRTRPEFSLSIKLNSVEFQDGGSESHEARELCIMLENHGFDFVELTGGSYQSMSFDHKRDSTKKREAYFIEWAEQITPALNKTKVYVTGGFKTAGAMVEALNTVHGIGLARPAAQEPRLPHDILNGKVKGAIKIRIDDDDFTTSIVAGGTQIGQIAKDEEPIDLSDRENVEGFFEDMKKWSKKMADDTDVREQGYVQIESVSPKPYGVAKN